MGLSCKSNTSIILCQSSSPTNKTTKLQVFKFRDLEVATRGFSKDNLIGKASHGYVYKGTLKDGRVVAVKRPTLGRQLWQDENAFENEIEILSKLFSRRLVNLLGFSQDGREKLLVVESMVNGTLHSYLHSQESHASNLSWPVRVHLVLQTAKAIRALHAASPPIVHRNIKPSNVFIDRNWNARLGDFGLALCVRLEDQPSQMRLFSIPESEPGPANSVGVYGLDHMDSETSSRISTKTDVFSFGMLLLEVMTGRSAISLDADFNPCGLCDWALPLIKHGDALAICDPRVPRPDCTQALKQLATIAARCVRVSSSRRPSMDDVVGAIANVSKMIPLPMWNGLTGVRRKKELVMDFKGQTLTQLRRLIVLPVLTDFLKGRKVAMGLHTTGLAGYFSRAFQPGTTSLPTSPIGVPKSAKVSDERPQENGLVDSVCEAHTASYSGKIIPHSKPSSVFSSAAGIYKKGIQFMSIVGRGETLIMGRQFEYHSEQT